MITHKAKVHESQIKDYKRHKIGKSKIISESVDGEFTQIEYEI